MTSKSAKYSSSDAHYSQKIMDQLATSEEYKIAGEHEKAIDIAEKILLDDPLCLAAIEELADNFLSLEKYSKAEKSSDFALTLDPKSYIANYTKGFLELSHGNWKKAVGYLQIANEGQTNNPEILRCLGWGLFHSENQIEGLSTLDRALNLRSDDPMILCDLGVCCLHCNSFKKAVSLFEKALEVSPGNVRAEECLKAAQDLKNKIETAQEEEASLPSL